MEVLLPAPLGPRQPKTSPRRTFSVSPRTATLPSKTLRRRAVEMASSATCSGGCSAADGSSPGGSISGLRLTEKRGLIYLGLRLAEKRGLIHSRVEATGL